MKLVISSSALHRTLKALAPVVSKNPIIPILEYALLEVYPAGTRLTVSDLQTTVVASLEVETTDSFRCLLPFTMLSRVLSKLPEQPITLDYNDSTYTVVLYHSAGFLRMKVDNPIDFPRTYSQATDGKPMQFGFDIAPARLRSLLTRARVFLSTDDLRPAMTGIYFRAGEESLTAAATDGHRLIELKAQVDTKVGGVHHFILPGKAGGVLTGLLKDTPGYERVVQVLVGVSRAYLSWGNYEVVARLVDERYPDYENALPDTSAHSFRTFNRRELLAAIDRLVPVANQTTYQGRFDFDDSPHYGTLSVTDLDYSNEATERIAHQQALDRATDRPDCPPIGFNLRLLRQSLATWDSEPLLAQSITMFVSGSNRAAIFTSPADPDCRVLLMPTMLNVYA